jgi:hypothetical protein
LRRKGVGIALGEEVDMQQAAALPKSERRVQLSAAIYADIVKNYQLLLEKLT